MHSFNPLLLHPSVDMVYTLAWESVTFTKIFDCTKGSMDAICLSLNISSPLLVRHHRVNVVDSVPVHHCPGATCSVYQRFGPINIY